MTKNNAIKCFGMFAFSQCRSNSSIFSSLNHCAARSRQLPEKFDPFPAATLVRQPFFAQIATFSHSLA
ncbi:hypothetical protein HMPREF3038_00990 [Akkermansia sp. KLE1797]|nr:hypothetical protein HMPREF3038_00990 [Akkermansia sp. KLE1797]KXU54361.1 hypothetical protein HMPREF3039_01252 [Akkermansia sp. KLE1798]KZA05010.1 hypothetical protein HMPREF1326_01329 [Akkermansia sp. KLE1605]